ncbi:hypothetical protein MNBD_GAMMA01-1874 [hydrothermal vent metagenome]|uniref:DUF1022 domain-containing protein n=1 Tax=hydrothermal vent metagenome TaxID=652676 RepID=A0A3B0VCM4_9ZZZZ
MKKLNHCWVFADSINGHEIQSLALAAKITNCVTIFHCGIRQPWLSFAPRVLPRFGKNIIWKQQKPDINNAPDIIITCGRRMAAVGKYYTRQTGCKHVQILNPGDSLKKYDVLVCPEHDNLTAANVIASKGSLHNISISSLTQTKTHCPNYFKASKIVSLLLGNPAKSFFKDLDKISTKINQHFPAHKLIVCGSRRTPERYYSTIKQSFPSAKLVWLTDDDGNNPYKCLLACSDVLIISADSINMVSEACATDKTVIAIGQQHISPKHQKFINSVNSRLSTYSNYQKVNQPLVVLSEVASKVVHMLKNRPVHLPPV